MSINYTDNATNQYTTIDSTDITYDANGNLTYGGQYVGSSAYTYVYDAQNRLVEVKDGSTSKFTYTYDTFGRRVSKPKSAQSGTTLSFCYAGGRIIAEYENGVFARKYVYGAGLDEPIFMVDAAGNRYYYFYDGLGSVAALSNANNVIVEAYCYDAFGQVRINVAAGQDGNWLTPDGSTATASVYGNRFMFTGREYDSETRLYCYRARMYSPQLGRFLQPDPIGYADSMNLYAYCGNNPINFIDPWGLNNEKPIPGPGNNQYTYHKDYGKVGDPAHIQVKKNGKPIPSRIRLSDGKQYPHGNFKGPDGLKEVPNKVMKALRRGGIIPAILMIAAGDLAGAMGDGEMPKECHKTLADRYNEEQEELYNEYMKNKPVGESPIDGLFRLFFGGGEGYVPVPQYMVPEDYYYTVPDTAPLPGRGRA